jgi:hypothetical protein
VEEVCGFGKVVGDKSNVMKSGRIDGDIAMTLFCP